VTPAQESASTIQVRIAAVPAGHALYLLADKDLKPLAGNIGVRAGASRVGIGRAQSRRSHRDPCLG
jgi:hypothetical protein